MKKPQNIVTLFGLCAAILIPNAAQAHSIPPGVYININASSPETITLAFSFAGPDAILNGLRRPSGGSETFDRSVVNTISLSGLWDSGGPLTIAPIYVDFYEDNTLTTITDQLVYSFDNTGYSSGFGLSFTTAVRGGNPLLPRDGATIFVKQFDSGGFPQAYSDLWGSQNPLWNSMGMASLGVSVTPSTVTVVPEPSIIAFGFLGAFFGIQRLRRREKVS